MRILVASLACLFTLAANADILKTVQVGATDQTVTLRIIDSTDGTPETGVVFNTSGIDLEYWRHGANTATDITEATQTVSGAHSDGGFVHIGHGVYRLDLPDAAVASGATAVDVYGTVTGMIVLGGTVQLTAVNLQDSVRMGMTALPNAAADAAGGLPISDAGGLDLDGLNTNVNDVETDTADMQPKLGTIPDLGGGATLGQNLRDLAGATFVTADDSNEAIRNRGDAAWVTGGGGACTADVGCIADGTAQAATGTTIQLAAAETFADNEIRGATVVIASATAGTGQSRLITGYVGSTDTATVDAWETTPTGTITYRVHATPPGSSTSPAPVNLVQLSGDATAADNAELFFDGTGYAGTGNTIPTVTSVTNGVTLATGAVTAAAIATGAIDADAIATDAIGAAEIAAAAITNTEFTATGTGLSAIPWNAAWDAEVQSEAADAINADTGDTFTAVPWNAAWDAEAQSEAEDAINVRLEQMTRTDAAVVNCEVNTLNFAGSTTTVACILTDRADTPITAANGDLEGRELLILSGAQIYEGRFINDTTWDGVNSELRLTLSRALPGTLADAVTAIIR